MMTTLHGLAVLLLQHGENEQARDALRRCLDFWRRDDDPFKIAVELNSLGVAHRALGEPDMARELLEESVGLARGLDAKGRLATSLCNLALVDLDQDRAALATTRLQEALALDQELGDTWGMAADRINLVSVLLHEDRAEEALRELRDIARPTVELGDVELTINVIELFACGFARQDDARRAARMLGASHAMRRKAELPITSVDAAMIERHIQCARPTDSTAWDVDLRTGAGWSVDEALDEADRAPAR
jgi:tetratricopeptide (TPR) repeat protein